MYVEVASYNSIIVCSSVWALLVAETKSYKYTQLEAPGQLPLGGSPCHKQNSFLWGHVGTQGKIHTKNSLKGPTRDKDHIEAQNVA